MYPEPRGHNRGQVRRRNIGFRMTNALTLMIEALGLEAATIRKRGRGTEIALRDGERVSQSERAWLYRFVVAEEFSVRLFLRDDTPVRVIAGEEEVPGVLVSFQDGIVRVALEKDLGPTIASARLISNDAFLVEQLRDRLQKVHRSEARFCKPAAERALGLLLPKTADAEPDPSVTSGGDLNADQIGAVRRSLGSETTFVWGPPGTGKTKTLAHVVEAHYRAGRTVLLVSNTNIAVDTALERIAERLKGEPDFHQGLAIRLGPVVKESLRLNFGPQVIPEEIVARLGERLQHEKEALTREKNALLSEEKINLAKLEDLQQLAHARRMLSEREHERNVANLTIEKRRKEAASYRERAAMLRVKLERVRNMGSVRRFLGLVFLGLDPKQLEQDASVAEREAQAALAAAEALAADLRKRDAEIQKLRSEVAQMASKTRDYPPQAQIEADLAALRSRLTRLRERLSVIERELADLEQEVLARCRIVATTVYRTYLGKFPKEQFDAVVIDEASMLIPPLVFYAAGLAEVSVTVAGDFRQLPPIVMCDQPLAQEWLKRDAFEIAGIPAKLKAGKPPPYLIRLGIQYRMEERICTVLNRLFYADYPLRSIPNGAEVNSDFPLGTAPLLYLDTAPLHPWAALRAGSHSRYNLLHALLVRAIVQQLAESGFIPLAGEANDAVGAVSPYAAQAQLIQALLDSRLGKRAAGIVATVHRFQGDERRTMVLDLTDSWGVKLGKFLGATKLEEDGARLLNVAVSRARRHLILIANFEYLRKKAPQQSFARRLIDHFADHGEPLDPNAVLPLIEQDWIDGLHRILPPDFELPEGAAGAFCHANFFPAFIKDLEHARQSAVILSPFVTRRGIARLADAFRLAVMRGVRIHILTRPPDESGVGGIEEGREHIAELRALGILVDLRKRMHEKIAILDERILWHGSLNILSYRDTEESMLRLESPAACKKILQFLSALTGRRLEQMPAFANPRCPKCGGPTVWKDGIHGIFFECEDDACGGKRDARNGFSARRAQKVRNERSRFGHHDDTEIEKRAAEW